MTETLLKLEEASAVSPLPNEPRPTRLPRAAAETPISASKAGSASRPGQILRFLRSERVLHWSIAIPFMVCYATALILLVFYNPHPRRPFRDVFSWLHRISGVSLIVFPILAMVRNRGDYRMHLYNVKQAWTWAIDDLKWLVLMGAAAVSSRISLPEQGKFNAAEKLNFMMVMCTYPLFIATGLLLWMPGIAFLSWIVHVAMAAVATPLLLGHIFMATINPGTRVGLSGMFSGYVDRQWAKHHYRRWYRENFEDDKQADGERGEARQARRRSAHERSPHSRWTFETNVPGVFLIRELAGMGLSKSAINEGKLVIDLLKARLEAERAGAPKQSPATSEPDVFDVAIVGSGPAGLSASLTAHQSGLRYLALEQGEIAATPRQHPRGKSLMAEPIGIPLYGSLHAGDGAKDSLLAVWQTMLANTGVQVHANERVERVQRNNTAIHVETTKGHYRARYVVLAMGRRGTPRRLGVPGENLAKVSYRLIVAEAYENRDLLVVGGGDSAVEAALALSRSGRNRVTLSYRGDSFHRAQERNQQQLDTAEKAGKIQVLRNSNLAEIRADSVILEWRSSRKQLPNHFAFILIGGESPEEFLRRTGVEIVEKNLSA
ncbi:MAG: NAD(P)-binding domain-containing protein [Acidobacteria bacterium]|nr:NAD(P)-binding domain-containing protein [Acidobacteriota bacterium]